MPATALKIFPSLFDLLTYFFNLLLDIALGPFGVDSLVDGETFFPDNVLAMRNEEYGPRTDGKPYVWPENIVPFRMYVGVKGKREDGTDAPADDFLARNGLRYGNLYGFAIDMKNGTSPSGGLWRDEWHKTAQNGDYVPGKWIAQPWRWDGVVRNFQHDGKLKERGCPKSLLVSLLTQLCFL
jgi:hypothetical protein